ncbi:MAG: UPF0175 family protein [Bacteroidota bacterium]
MDNQLTLTLPPGINADEACLLLAIQLYEDERVSLGKAAELAGYSKRTFLELLSRRGIAVIDHAPEDLEIELDLDLDADPPSAS